MTPAVGQQPPARALFKPCWSGLGAHRLDPEYDCRCDAYCREECVGASVVGGCGTVPVLELGEEVLHLVALAIERLVVGISYFVASAGEHQGRGLHSRGHTHLPLAEQQDDRAALAIADSVQLGVQPAFGPPDTTGNIPFLSRRAAVRRAFRCVASIMMCSGRARCRQCRPWPVGGARSSGRRSCH